MSCLGRSLFFILLSFATASAETFSTWQTAHFTTAQVGTPFISGPLADPDGDGISNLLEYAYASDPWAYDLSVAPLIAADQNHLTLTYRRLRAASDLFTGLQATADLKAGWFFPDNVSSNTDISHPNYDLITLTDPQSTSGTDRRFLHLTVAIDSDQDGLPDDWEMRFFGNLDHLAGGDEDFDTLTNLMEFHQQSDPTNFFNGETPQIVLTSGDAQVGFTNDSLTNELAVTVYHQDGVTSWANAPIVFTTTAGGWFNGSVSPATIRADSSGVATVSYTLPATAGSLSIVATAGKIPNVNSVTFSETASGLPPDLGPITIEGTGTSMVIGWEPASAATGYTIQRRGTGDWVNVSTVGAGEKSFTDTDTNLQPGVITIYKVLGNDGTSLHAESAVEGGVVNPADNNDTDAMSNGEEVAAGYYSQALADAPPNTSTTLKYGGNPRGWCGPDPKLTDTDGDGVPDDLDGWANNPALHPARLPETHYAVLDLEQMGFPADYHILKINDKLQVLAVRLSYDAGYFDGPYPPVQDVILWDAADQSTTPVPILSPDPSRGYQAPYGSRFFENHKQLLNNSGVVCGMVYNATTGWCAATWTKAGGTVVLPSYNSPWLSGTSIRSKNDYVVAISDAGDVVGTNETVGTTASSPTAEGDTIFTGGGVKWSVNQAVAIGDHWQRTYPGSSTP